MFDIGFSELVLIGVLGLIVLGPERLPQAAKTVGIWVRKIRNIAKNLSSEIERELEIEDLRKELANKNQAIMKQADSLSKKLNKPVEEIFSFDEKPHSEVEDTEESADEGTDEENRIDQDRPVSKKIKVSNSRKKTVKKTNKNTHQKGNKNHE